MKQDLPSKSGHLFRRRQIAQDNYPDSDFAPVHLVYRPDIDGLRAVAVLSVVAYHAAPGRVPGGFIGVDIFFVISGFLITSIIINGLNNQTFDFLDFYYRRVRRIFPALIIVLFSSLVFGLWFLLDDELASLGKNITAGAVFVSNFSLWRENNYFDISSAYKPLLHLWSLGIEEQFYIVWPLLLWGASRRKYKYIFIIGIIGVSSFALNVSEVITNPTAAFYSPLSRFWELLTGSGLAAVILIPNQLKAIPIIFRNASAFLGLASIATSMTVINQNRMFPDWWALLPVIGTVLIILAGSTSFVNRIFLSNRLVVWFGLISYPLYLWHWPLLAFPRIIQGTETPQWVRLFGVMLSILLAWMTFSFFEKRIRRLGSYHRPPLILVSAMMILGMSGFYIYIKDGNVERPNKPQVLNIGDLGSDSFLNYIKENYPTCLIGGRAAGECFESNPAIKEKAFLIGDSHAQNLFPGLASQLAIRNVVFYGNIGLPFINEPEFDRAFRNVLDDSSVHEVIIAAIWERKLHGLDVNEWGQKLAETVESLTKSGKRVILADDIPSFSFFPNRCKFNGRVGFKNNCIEDDHIQEHRYLETFNIIVDKYPRTKIGETHKQFCSDGKCFMAVGGVLLFRDEHHLTLAGSARAVPDIVAKISRDDF